MENSFPGWKYGVDGVTAPVLQRSLVAVRRNDSCGRQEDPRPPGFTCTRTPSVAEDYNPFDAMFDCPAEPTLETLQAEIAELKNKLELLAPFHLKTRVAR